DCVVDRLTGQLLGADTGGCDHEPQHRGGIFEYHHEARRVLPRAYGLEVAAPALDLGELIHRKHPRAAFKYQGDAEYHVIDEEMLVHLGVVELPGAAHQGRARADREQLDRHHEAPEVNLFSVSEREVLIRRTLRALESVQDQALVADVYRRVNTFGSHGRTAAE